MKQAHEMDEAELAAAEGAAMDAISEAQHRIGTAIMELHGIRQERFVRQLMKPRRKKP